MTREMEIQILMEDNCTKLEAERHLRNGTIVFEDFEENFESYTNEWNIEEDEELWKELKTMIETGKPAKDWGVVEMDGNTYYIMYVL